MMNIVQERNPVDSLIGSLHEIKEAMINNTSLECVDDAWERWEKWSEEDDDLRV